MYNALLSGNQFGYGKNRNPELASLLLTDKIFPAIEIGFHTYVFSLFSCMLSLNFQGNVLY